MLSKNFGVIYFFTREEDAFISMELGSLTAQGIFNTRLLTKDGIIVLGTIAPSDLHLLLQGEFLILANSH